MTCLIACRGPLVLVVLLAAAGATSCAAPPAGPGGSGRNAALVRHEFTHPALGTRFRVVVHCPDDPATVRAERAVIRRLAELDEIFDDARPTSELAQVYANAGIGSVRVSNDLFQVLREAEKLRARSEGAFDVTSGAYAELWQRSTEARVLPTDDELAQAGEVAGHDKLRLDPINRTVHLTTPGVRLDLSGFVPGYACDRVLAALRSAAMPSALVASGGRLAVGDAPPGRDAWLVKVNNAAPKSDLRVVRLVRQAIASSGAAGDVVEIGEITYGRSIDPRTGMGARNVAPVTTVARRAWQADAVARAATVLGQNDTRALLRSTPNVKVWFHTGGRGARHDGGAAPGDSR